MKRPTDFYGKKAVLYYRVSTSDQKQFGNSLNAQAQKLKQFCENHSIAIAAEFEEDYSAKNFDRPEFKKLHRYILANHEKIDYLFIYSWDRFSRNAREALKILYEFEELNVEINSPINWIDYSDPNHLIMQLLYLGLPEVENKIRSDKIKVGMRQSLLEGRWVFSQPKGYVKGRDEFDKPLMQIDSEIGPLINELFEDFGTGLYSQNELRLNPKYTKLKLSKSNLSRILQQIAYAGKIKVPATNDEPELIVDALHEPIISIELFYKVQNQLLTRKRFKQKPKKVNEKLPLRGLLTCSKCGSNLTGSGSKSKTGDKHYYYHCNPRKGCGERFKVSSAHLALLEELDKLCPSDEVLELFELMIAHKFDNSKISTKNLLKAKKNEIDKLQNKQDLLLERLLDGTLENDTYKRAFEKIESEILRFEFECYELSQSNQDKFEFIKKGLDLFKNIKSYFLDATVETKQKLLSSILEKKLVFEDGKYRTLEMKKGFQFIYQNINELKRIKQKNGRLYSDNLPICTRGGT